MTESTCSFPSLITEKQAYQRYKGILQDKELRRARRSGQIGFYKRSNRFYYREDELSAFVAGLLEASYVSPTGKGSNPDPVPRSRTQSNPAVSGISGMTPELERAAARLLVEQLFRRPKQGQDRRSTRLAKSERRPLTVVAPSEEGNGRPGK